MMGGGGGRGRERGGLVLVMILSGNLKVMVNSLHEGSYALKGF